MRIRPPSEDNEEVINLSSLLDILFILITFFPATSTFEEEEKDVKVNLPNATHHQLPPRASPGLFSY